MAKADCLPGFFPAPPTTAIPVQLYPGDAVLFATDGLHELRDRHDKDFSWERLQETWLQCRCRNAEDSLTLLFEDARKFCEGGSEQQDDITTVVLKVRG